MKELLIECPDCKLVQVSDRRIGDVETCCVCYKEFKITKKIILDKMVF